MSRWQKCNSLSPTATNGGWSQIRMGMFRRAVDVRRGVVALRDVKVL